ncbi:hypothetical protein PMAYCL1PPCAC_09417 [Pristionchus mayeri]|uniref:Uncharacterized protein n=1 Tax=Pristionchus mayeri TaxID=1317129 RepID=A0AAN4ZJF9_9BILA|nr:hypothetical protein PMAYCL1PPCAC_09417 [Pristionchus mayeri]
MINSLFRFLRFRAILLSMKLSSSSRRYFEICSSSLSFSTRSTLAVSSSNCFLVALKSLPVRSPISRITFSILFSISLFSCDSVCLIGDINKFLMNSICVVSPSRISSFLNCKCDARVCSSEFSLYSLIVIIVILIVILIVIILRTMYVRQYCNLIFKYCSFDSQCHREIK